MSKKVKIILISILLFVLGAGVVNASSASATLITDSQNIKAGETFTVTFVANCEEGINGLESKISYDTDKLEFVKAETADATKWTNLGEGLTVQILNISSESIKESQIFKMTFKAKDNIVAGTTANITVDGIVIDSEAQTDSSKSVAAQTISLNVVADEEPAQGTEQPEGDDNKEDQEQATDKETEDKDPATDKETEDKDPATDKETEDKDPVADKEAEDKDPVADNKDSNTNKEETKDDKETNTKEESKKDNKVPTNNVSTSTNTKKDNTTASKEYPKTGAEIIVLPIVIITISLIASYMGYKKYRGI